MSRKPVVKLPPKLKINSEVQKNLNLAGHMNVNVDTGLISYDYPKVLPLVVKGTLSGEKIRAFSQENRDRLDFMTVGAQLSTKNIPKSVLFALIADLEKVLDDLKQIDSLVELTESNQVANNEVK